MVLVIDNNIIDITRWIMEAMIMIIIPALFSAFCHILPGKVFCHYFRLLWYFVAVKGKHGIRHIVVISSLNEF